MVCCRLFPCRGHLKHTGGHVMENFEFYSPTYFVFGKGTENETGKFVKKYGGHKVLIHYGGGSVVRSGLLDRVKGLPGRRGHPARGTGRRQGQPPQRSGLSGHPAGPEGGRGLRPAHRRRLRHGLRKGHRPGRPSTTGISGTSTAARPAPSPRPCQLAAWSPSPPPAPKAPRTQW